MMSHTRKSACLVTALATALAACSFSEPEGDELSSDELTSSFPLFVSASASRTSAHALAGATLAGKAYVFTGDTSGGAHPAGIKEVRYWLDDTTMKSAPARDEHVGPYDFGGTAADGTALAWDTSKLAKGNHTITEAVTLTSGAVQTATATFAIGTTSAPPPPPPPSTGKIKWNPGHYMASGTVAHPGATIATSNWLPYELGALDNHDTFIGYRMLITWAALEPAKGQYDFSIIKEVMTYLKTKLNKPKHFVLVVLPGSFTNTKADKSTIPDYILSNSAYGPSPVAGSYGWWGGTGNGNTSAACLYRPAVLDRWIALHQALGKEFDADPSFEGIMFQEDSWVMGAWTTNKPPDYAGDTAMLGDFEKLLLSTLTAFPHTNVIFQNTWMGTPTTTGQLEQFMIQHRVAPSTADTFGQTYVDKRGGKLNSWGLEFYAGHTVAGSTYSGPDYRSQMPSMVDIEGPDLGMYQNMGGTIGVGGYAPEDICTALNQSYAASHAFWTYLGNGSTVPTETRWPSLAQTVSTSSACKLTHTTYPVVYPK